ALASANAPASANPVDAAGRPAEQRELLVGGGAGYDALERVPERRPADAHLVDGEIALEHAAAQPEELDARLDEGAPESGQLLGGGRRGRGAVVERRPAHHHASELHHHVVACGQVVAPGLPGPDTFLLL